MTNDRTRMTNGKGTILRTRYGLPLDLGPWSFLGHSGLVILTFLLAGCTPQTKAPATAPYTGPTLPLRGVVAGVNANNSRLPTLWADGTFDVRVRDPRAPGKSQYVNGQVRLLYESPVNLRLIGRKDIAGQVFDIASNKELYWLEVGGDTDTLWYGRHELATSANLRDLPIRPDLLIDVLGVGKLDPNLLTQPVPVLRFNPDADAYMVTFDARAPDRWVAQREVWYDRQTLLPRLVLLFDPDGRVVLRAYLSNPVPVQGSGENSAAPAQLAGTYQLYFPDSGSELRIDLKQAALSRNRAPNAASFVFPGEKSKARRVVPIDEPDRIGERR